jgi:secreted Zn-dependent insulinase-like peptidase
VKHFTFKIQSSTKDPDYLEHRINAFLEDRQDWQPKEE